MIAMNYEHYWRHYVLNLVDDCMVTNAAPSVPGGRGHTRRETKCNPSSGIAHALLRADTSLGHAM